jgi:hypothetical protein
VRRIALAGAILIACVGATASISPVTDLAGRYSKHWQNGLVDGSTYWSDDVLEIVPVGPGKAYLRASLQFYNGHSCDLAGIAHAEGDALVYRAKDPNYKGCVFSVRRSGANIALADKDDVCRSYFCGERGGLNTTDALPAKSKRPISYMAKLKGSSQFKTAVEEDARK